MIELEEMPDEVIVNIFSYLSLMDRKNTRLVSKRWYQLSYSMCLIKNDITSVNNYLLLDKAISPNVRHINVRTRIVVDKNCSLQRLRGIQFWSTYGQDIKSVEIYLIDGYQEVLLDVFGNCPNIEHLYLSYSYDNVTLGLQPRNFPSTVPYSINFPKLLSVNFNNMAYLSKEALQRFTEKAPKLERISLEWWMEQEQDESILEVFLEVVRRQSHQLKEISLSRSSISDTYVIQIAEILGPQLTGFYINHCKNLTNHSIPIMAKQFTNIKKLDICKCSFSEKSLVKLLSGLTKLTHVCLRRAKNLTNAAIAALKFAPNLETLDIADCRYVTDEGIIRFFGDSVKVKMMDLRLSRVDRITDEAIVKISPNLPNLRTLYLNGCNGLTDRSLEAIFTHNRLLRCFSIQDCIQMRDLSVGPSINALKGLIRLDVYGCLFSANSVNSLNLIELRKADLNVEGLTVADISSVLNGCPSLQYLYLVWKLKPVENMIKFNKIAPLIQYGFSGFEPDSIFDHTRLFPVT